jgi:hypothetical protein
MSRAEGGVTTNAFAVEEGHNAQLSRSNQQPTADDVEGQAAEQMHSTNERPQPSLSTSYPLSSSHSNFQSKPNSPNDRTVRDRNGAKSKGDSNDEGAEEREIGGNHRSTPEVPTAAILSEFPVDQRDSPSEARLLPQGRSSWEREKNPLSTDAPTSLDEGEEAGGAKDNSETIVHLTDQPDDAIHDVQGDALHDPAAGDVVDGRFPFHPWSCNLFLLQMLTLCIRTTLREEDVVLFVT